MPAAKETKANEDLREEFEALRGEVTEMMALLKGKASAEAETITAKAEEKLEDYQEKVTDGVEAAYEKGAEGIEEISGRIRKNPVGSLCVAFGLGYIISKMMDQGKK
ncbi:DUF883 family protein [Leucothrix arctica]|uniref:DUF883 domain-containing protein n=1 Tax=Leucothrix arctica TaxID=1481894 RepID=A0A317CAX9_9GAMM|nr:DUF883 family protein [Leucothrix arctica]PWQ95686.1 hypothetical protein DKT75_11675 [Leucothrix arctica]